MNAAFWLWLDESRACSDARRWLRSLPSGTTPRQAWAMCPAPLHHGDSWREWTIHVVLDNVQYAGTTMSANLAWSGAAWNRARKWAVRSDCSNDQLGRVMRHADHMWFFENVDLDKLGLPFDLDEPIGQQ